MKTNIILVISVRIRSVFIPTNQQRRFRDVRSAAATRPSIVIYIECRPRRRLRKLHGDHARGQCPHLHGQSLRPHALEGLPCLPFFISVKARVYLNACMPGLRFALPFFKSRASDNELINALRKLWHYIVSKLKT